MIMKYFLEDMLETIALALLMFLALQVSVRNYRVELSSMEATLFAKDRLVVNKLVYLHLDSEVVDGLAPFVDVWDDQSALFPVPPAQARRRYRFPIPQGPQPGFCQAGHRSARRDGGDTQRRCANRR